MGFEAPNPMCYGLLRLQQPQSKLIEKSILGVWMIKLKLIYGPNYLMISMTAAWALFHGNLSILYSSRGPPLMQELWSDFEPFQFFGCCCWYALNVYAETSNHWGCNCKDKRKEHRIHILQRVSKWEQILVQCDAACYGWLIKIINNQNKWYGLLRYLNFIYYYMPHHFLQYYL